MNLSSGVAVAVTAWLNNEDWISFGDWLRDYFLNVPIFQNFFLLVRETRTRETWITFQEDYYITIFLPKKPFSNKINRPCLPILEKKVCHRQTTWPLGYAWLRCAQRATLDVVWCILSKNKLKFLLKDVMSLDVVWCILSKNKLKYSLLIIFGRCFFLLLLSLFCFCCHLKQLDNIKIKPVFNSSLPADFKMVLNFTSWF